MFGLTFLALFTGTVLKWDQEGYEALGHNLESAKLLGGDRSPARYWRARPVAMILGALVLIGFLVLTLMMLFTSPAEHLGM